MLDRAHRLRSSRQFAAAIRRGQRAGSSTVVVHLAPSPDAGIGPVRVGLVVGKAVGNSVVRNKVKRRLRHLARERLAALPEDSVLVIRALPPAGTASSRSLARDLDSALQRSLRVGTRA